jgi:hypothetical protein
MNSLFKGSAGTTVKHGFLPSPRWNWGRLRRKGPSWIGLVLLVLAVDFVLAAAAWNAVDFFRH